MMNYVYLFFDSNHQNIAEMCLRSLYRSNKSATVICDVLNVEKIKLQLAFPGVIINDLNPVLFNNRIATYKIERLAGIKLESEDKIFIIDPDIIVLKDLFIDLPQADVYITSRHYEFVYEINGGVFGFTGTNAGKEMIAFYNDQVHQKDWEPYQNFLMKYGHYNNTNWSVGQDFLCTIYRNSPPFDCKIIDLGPDYNYCPNACNGRCVPGYYAAIADIKTQLNTSCRVLHFKSALKFEMPAIEKIILENN